MILAFAGQKGGVGKSTLSMAVACEFLSRRFRTLLVDGDFEQGTIRVFHDIAREQGVPTPAVIAMDKNMYETDQLPAVSQDYEITVIDCPPRYAKIQRAALMVADIAILPVGPNPADMWALTNTIALVKEALSIRPELKAFVVINRKDARTVLGRRVRETLESIDLPVLKTEIANRIALAEAPASGLGVTGYAPRDQASDEIRALVDEITELGGIAVQPKPEWIRAHA